MNFLNSTALWGGLAAVGVAVPIIIHLLHQRHRRRTDWAAMELLRKALVIRSGQIKLEDLLLLFLRCLVLALVAFALVRPTVEEKTANFLAGDQSVGMVIAIDASYSMASGKLEKRMDAAKSRVSEILSTARASDSVTIVLLGDQPRTLLRGANYEEQRINEALKDVQPFPESLNLERSLKEVSSLIEELEASVIECYFVTDAQEKDWKNLSSQAKADLDAIGEASNLFLVPVQLSDGENLAVMKFGYSSGSLGPGGTARFTAEIKNFDNQPNGGSVATLLIDDQPESAQRLGTLEPGETKVVSFFTSLDLEGKAKLSVSLSPDTLRQDNFRHTVVEARKQVRILCVDGQPATSNNENSSEIFWLTKALELKQAGGSGPVSAIRINWRDLEAETFEDFDIIALANVSKVEQVSGKLADFVSEGGGLMLFAGDLIEAESYNTNLREQEVNLLPAKIIEPISFGEESSSNDDNEGFWTLGPIQSGHVLAKLAEKIPEEARNSIRFQRFMKVEPDANATTILSLSESNQPLLLEKRVGDGTVLMFTTTADRAWSNLAVEPLFPILIQQAVTHMTSRPGQNDFLVGDSLTLPIKGLEVGSSVKLTAPDGSSRQVTLTEPAPGVAACPIETDDAGFFIVETDDSSPISLAANVDPRESETRGIQVGEWKQLVGSNARIIPREAKNLATEVKESRKGMEISRTLLLLALAIFILQGFLAKLFTNRMTSSGESNLEESLRQDTVTAARRS